MRIATFNLENLDDETGQDPSLATRVAIMRLQLDRLAADILCLQEVHSQDSPQGRTLAALDTLLAGTSYEPYERLTTTTASGQSYQERKPGHLEPVPSGRSPTDHHPGQQRSPSRLPGRHRRPTRSDRRPFGVGAAHPVYPGRPGRRAAAACAEPASQVQAGHRHPRPEAERLHLEDPGGLGRGVLHLLHEAGWSSPPGPAGAGSAVHRGRPGRRPGPPDRSVRRLQRRQWRGARAAICGQVEDTGNPAHGPRVMVACQNQIAESARYSLFHLGRGEMIDHVLASRALLATLEHTEIHNEYLPDESGASRTDVQFPESDHAPVVAQFSMADG